MSDPTSRPTPVMKKGGMPESEVAKVASDAQSATAPRASRSAFTQPAYGSVSRRITAIYVPELEQKPAIV